MLVTGFDTLSCPLDALPLRRQAGSWRCEAGHSFDIAREGHTHLLPVQHKRSRDPGDSKEMIAARRRFLEAGHYAPLAEALAGQVLDGAGDTLTCLDAGCGEGYYLRRLIQTAEGRAGRLALLGLDISKWAVLAAAKAERRASWVVGSNARLPVPDTALDRLLCAFGFPVYPEFARALRPGGRLLQLDPGPDHLRELREVIYPSLKPPRPRELSAEGLSLSGQQRLRYRIELASPAAIADLLLMTPHMYRAGPDGRARAAALAQLTVTVDVELSVFTRD